MKQHPRIELLPGKKLVGKRLKMTLADNKTAQLWQSLMPHISSIQARASRELISMQVYGPSFDFKNFTPDTEFEKWAVAEVTSFINIPLDMEKYELTGGLYAVFIHKGTPHDFPKTMSSIFEVWLPQSAYEPDQREHFEVLGDKYKNNDPDSEEEVWIPIRKKING